MSEQKIYKPKPISGFPEWLPEYRAIELQWMDKIRKVFERYGFCSIETPSVEEIEALEAKGGETEKEIYVLGRIHDDGNPQLIADMYKYHLKQGKAKEEAFGTIKKDLTNFFSHNMDSEAASIKASDQILALMAAKETRLALHFDLTVPMARYVAQHFNDLVFPFKRYQIQRVWRGERPQKGRAREFYQCDIDVVNVDSLPLHFDAELPAVMFEAYQALDIPPIEMHLNNRKIIIGYLEGIGIKDIPFVTRELDKLGKLGVEKLTKILTDSFQGDAALAQKCLALAQIQSSDNSFADKIRALGITNELLEQGLSELTFVMDNLQHLPKGSVIADLGIIRGLDYYTGTVVEVYFKDKPGMAIGSGGRYDNLAGSFISQKLPGIGVSIGLTRLFWILLEDGYIKPGPKSPTQILVVLPEESRRAEAAETARQLRQLGYNVELFHSDSKVKRQLSYAERKGIPFVWFPPFEDGKQHEVKNMATGTQSQVNLSNTESLREILK
jgi:histidyl-tRNA synthetase